MRGKPNVLYLMSGGGTSVISASAYGLINHIYENYRSDPPTPKWVKRGKMRSAALLLSSLCPLEVDEIHEK